MTLAAGLAARSVRAPRLAAPGPDSHHARLDLEPDPASVAGARLLARELLARLGWDSERAADAVLLVSELVTNATVAAVPPGGDWPAIILTLYGNPGELSILAWDNGSLDGLPDEPGLAADDAEYGRGLGITATLTGGEWGWWETPHCGGKVIWAYLGLGTRATLTQEGNPPMTQQLCTCGYKADSPEDLIVHFGEMFIPADDTAPDGQVHCELARDEDAAKGSPAPATLTCRCGFTCGIDDFDQHLTEVFTPADRVGLDGQRHAPDPPADMTSADA